MSNNYSDSSEKFLLNFFSKPQSQKHDEIKDVLSNNSPWPILYHLHPQREFLLSWYPFKKNSLLLEVGAGCGALTGLFCQKVKKVYANELTEERAEIIKKRYADKKNLIVSAKNFNDEKIKIKFDYITLIGVLEYQGRYTKINNDDINVPYINFLKNIKKFLKNDGVVLLAIENKLGLKYLAGSKEDHYGIFGESINNYPHYDGIKTFSKSEIINIIKQAGFNQIKLYYPFPDYKMPYWIFTDESFNLNIILSYVLKNVDINIPREFIFNEVALGINLTKEKIINRFANSFLIEIKI